MKKILILLIFTISLFSCGTKKEEVQNKEIIVTSVSPLKGLVKEIVGDNYEVQAVVGENVSHESFEPTIKDVEVLEKAKLFFFYDLFAFEENLEENVKDENKVVNVLENVDEALFAEDEFHNDGHHHEHGHSHSHKHSHHHEHEHGEEGHDPHVWFSIEISKKVAENVLNKLIETNPEKENEFKENYSKYIEKLEKFDEESKKVLDELGEKAFIIYHPALTYFVHDTKVLQIAIETEGKEPSVKEMEEIIEEAKEHNVQLILVQPQFSKESAKSLSNEIEGAKVVEFNVDKEDVIENLQFFLNNLK